MSKPIRIMLRPVCAPRRTLPADGSPMRPWLGPLTARLNLSGIAAHSGAHSHVSIDIASVVIFPS